MEETYQAGADVHVLPSYLPIPGYGVLPVNAFLLRAAEPVLVDTGMPVDRGSFLAALGSLIDLGDIRWLWLTHADPDHLGSLRDVLWEAPRLKVVTTFIGAGKLGMSFPLPLERTLLLNPGQSLDVGDRSLTAVKPPSFDAPETTGFVDGKSRTLFSSDCFGAVLAGPAEDARAIPEDELARCQTLWSTVDAPWMTGVDRGYLQARLDVVRSWPVDLVLSSHLPAAMGLRERFLATLAAVPDAPPFVGPDQAALERLVLGAAAGPPSQERPGV